MRKGVDLINYQNHSTHQNMTKKNNNQKAKAENNDAGNGRVSRHENVKGHHV